MSALNQILAQLDHAKRRAGRNVRDLTSDPKGYLQMLSDRLNMFNKGEVAEINPLSAGTRKLSKQERTKQLTEAAMDAMGQGGMGALGVIKSRGGNWLPKGLPKGVHPEEALREHLRADHLTDDEIRGFFPDRPGEADVGIRKARAMDKWVQGPLQRYIMRDMATPEDPIRRLAEQGILHVDPQELNFNMSSYGKWPFDNQQFLAQSDMAKAWEGVTDNAISASPRWTLAPEPGSSRLSREHPWVDKLPEDTPLYGLNDTRHFADDVGFERLIRDVYGDLVEGKLRPEQLESGSFNVEAAVRLAHNKRMAELAAKEAEDLKRSRNAAVFTHKEYPDNNPEGFHWAEIRGSRPDEDSIPELMNYLEDVPENVYEDLTGIAQKRAKAQGITDPDELDEFMEDEMNNLMHEWAITQRDIDYPPTSRSDLQQALSYEGDMMGHCVGDYCDDVAGGTTRIFSLRDAKGKPHVTIEARSGRQDTDFTEADFLDFIRDKGFTEPTNEAVEAWERHLRTTESPTWSIQQIKGSGKKDPTQAILKEDLPKYQPYLVDFLNSQPWGEVRDLKNTGLIDAHSLYDPEVSHFRFLTPEQQAKLHEANPSLKSKMGQALDDPNFNAGWEPDEHIEFAQGGLIRPRLGV